MSAKGTPVTPTPAELPPTMTRQEAQPSDGQRRDEAMSSGPSVADLERALGVSNRPVTVGQRQTEYK